MAGYVSLRVQALDTWTHEVCVLARCDEDKTPTRERLDELFSAGLGKAKLVFPDKKADHNKLQLFLEETFPKLKCGGGFEVFRACGGGGRPEGKVGTSGCLHKAPTGGLRCDTIYNICKVYSCLELLCWHS